MHKLYIGLGSNLGNKEEMLHRALELINKHIGSVKRTSSFIETEPWGFQSENTFLNAACLVETTLTPMQCLRETQKIERLLGRTQKSKDGVYHDRPIDLDLLIYDDVEMNTPELTLPHPHMHERDFVMIPLREIIEH
ncbi:MAG: 2-amino-4-hydroxy-6-hydroxymethyldihydropteridine diphosphokinase [Bacteroidaceae bacterium]|jgi:2-amino-4-hydroxy-6-hydroxymethyldihydropteridine diphosphokinase|nr:2-amino-4-hydroxy-6-hydroxymethyldihydropteridine diphosphokinase [Bacteroidaceae bacterium]